MPDLTPVLRTLYVAAAVAGFVALFVPFYVQETAAPVAGVTPSDNDTYSVVSSLGIADGRVTAILGVLVALALIAAALVASVGLPGRTATVAVVLLAVVGVVMVLSRPGAGDSSHLGPGAGGLLGAAVLLLATALADLWFGMAPAAAPAARPGADDPA